MAYHAADMFILIRPTDCEPNSKANEYDAAVETRPVTFLDMTPISNSETKTDLRCNNYQKFSCYDDLIIKRNACLCWYYSA